MKNILSRLFIALTFTSGAQNIWRAPSVFEQPVNFKAAISQNSGTDSLKINTVGANSIFSHGTGALLLKDGKATIGLFDTTGYRVAATPINIQLQQGATDSILISFSGDTANVNATVAAWNFTPPLPGGGGSGWNLTGNAGTNPATNFLGTTDNQPLFIKSDSIAIISYKGSAALIGVGNISPFGGTDSTVFIRGNIAAISAIAETNISGPILSITVDTTQIYSQLILGNGTQGAGKVLTSDATGLATWANGSASNVWSINGNSGTDPAINYLGTTDSMPMRIVNYANTDDDLPAIEINGSNIGASANYGVSINGNTGGQLSAVLISGISTFIGAEVPAITISGSSSNSTDITITPANGHLKLSNLGEANGKVLTSDANGFASWQGGIIYDSLTALTGETVTLTNNSTHIIAASGTVISVTWTFPTGATGDVLDIENMQIITTLNITGTGTGTITAAKITNTKTAGLKTFHNYGGNWY